MSSNIVNLTSSARARSLIADSIHYKGIHYIIKEFITILSLWIINECNFLFIYLFYSLYNKSRGTKLDYNKTLNLKMLIQIGIV